MNYLIVDLNITLDGHKLGFVQEMLHYLSQKQYADHQFHFLVNVDLEKEENSAVRVHAIDKSYQAKFDRHKGLKKYQEQWKYIHLKASQQSIDRVILMEFDLYQAAIGMDKNCHFGISGIWFRPYPRQQPIGLSLFGKLKFPLKRQQKKLLLRTALRNKRLDSIFILNDQATVDKLNARHGNRFAYLPDPVFEYNCPSLSNIRQQYGIDAARKILLVFGYIDDRKNIPNILKAVEKLSREEQSNLCLLMVGKVAPNYQELVSQAIDKHKSNAQLLQIDSFVENCEMEALFQQSDLVLRMNVNYFASSGIIGMAAKYNKPSLVSDYGIVAELTEKYALGKIADPLHIGQIKSALSDFLNHPEKWTVDGQNYFREHNTQAFVETLLFIGGSNLQKSPR
ncbi:glycosyltransferase [Marinilongibacter aquaticus]|uniref:glycosyltransferase n=1 Tax=Marinilongibacter aquaticus TaxID=2975157 RepID=UPI0021BD4261|nr:glycosyltransferase [Marinilongibacter aquaticus]UBM60101.1 glycosyltransferase [Marinilongibacter aquaticus]